MQRFVLLWTASQMLCDVRCARKEALTALQAMEQLDIRRASDEFAEQVEEYRKYFRARAPFAVADPQLTLAHVSFCSTAVAFLTRV